MAEAPASCTRIDETPMRFSIKNRMLTVAVLGLATCLLALYALGRPLAAANTNRIERARVSVEQEVERLRTHGPRRPDESSLLGVRSGISRADEPLEAVDFDIDPDAAQALAEVRGSARASHGAAHVERASGSVTIFAAADATEGGDVAWALYSMNPPRWTPFLRTVGVLLGLVSFALVLASLHTVVTTQREAANLKRSLASLSKDLSTPVVRPAVEELADVAEGIEHLARDLAKAQDALADRERLAVLGRVTAGVAHELRNPLALIKLRVDMAYRTENDPAAMKRELDDVLDEIGRLDRLVSDLLTVAGRKTGPRAAVAIDELAHRRVELMRPFMLEKGVAVHIEGRAVAPLDADAVGRLLDNLIRNAIDASASDGEVHIHIDSGDQDARVRIQDAGAGVPEDREEELFEPFFTTKPDGVGLGLALSRAIAVAHGGTLEYRRADHTTVFELILPRHAS